MGDDPRSLEEIIAADAATVEQSGRSIPEIVTRMWEITDAARQGLETSVPVGDHLEARVVEARGRIPCPWPHAGRYPKRVVHARRTDSDVSVEWSELNIHLIEAHGFFEGRGSRFRIEPAELIAVIF